MTVTLNNTALTISDLIQLIGILVSLLTGLIAIVISIITLRQSSKMIEESTRPNIQIYPIFMDSILYIVIKNFGSSEAVIDDIKCSHVFTKNEIFGNAGQNIFSKLNGAIFSPGYSLRCPLIAHAVSDEPFEFQIKYHSYKRNYFSTFSLLPYANAPFADTYPSANTTEDHLRNISRALHSIFKLNL